MSLFGNLFCTNSAILPGTVSTKWDARVTIYIKSRTHQSLSVGFSNADTKKYPTNLLSSDLVVSITKSALSLDDTLSVDEIQLRAQGHLPRQFSIFATLALAFSITNTWIGYSANFVTPLLAGAGRAVFCCLMLACVACTVIATGLAELASAFPSSGGQYQ